MRPKYISEPNYNGFLVIGAGLPRTGTASLRSALSLLLNGPIYHMGEVYATHGRDVPFWTEACAGLKKRDQWRDFFENRGYRGAVDFPVALFYKEIMAAYPEAKVILTQRSPETWYRSVKETIYLGLVEATSFPVKILAFLNGEWRMDNMCHLVTRRNGNRFGIGMRNFYFKQNTHLECNIRNQGPLELKPKIFPPKY